MKRLAAIVERGCIVCRREGLGPTPAEVHHLRGKEYAGAGQRASDRHTIPLCPIHHRHGGYGQVAYHRDPRAFEARYGTQAALLAAVDQEIGGDE